MTAEALAQGLAGSCVIPCKGEKPLTEHGSKGAAKTIPIFFSTGNDPVRAGLVASLNRPGGNVTGITSMNTELRGKRIGLQRELLPRASLKG